MCLNAFCPVSNETPPDDGVLSGALPSCLLCLLPAACSACLQVDGEAVRAPVALALVKLLRLLPPQVESRELPRALQVGAGQNHPPPTSAWSIVCPPLKSTPP